MFSKFRNKPRIVDAARWFPGSGIEGVEEVPLDDHGVRCGPDEEPTAIVGVVTTKQGQRVQIKAGEWVVREMDGTGFYPIDPDTFAATYEPVEDDTSPRPRPGMWCPRPAEITS